MERIKEFSLKPRLVLILITIVFILSGCGTNGTSATFTLNPTQPPLTVQPDQFNTVSKDGVEIACPKHWQTYSTDPSLVYGVYRTETIRIVIGVLPAADQSLYDDLVKQGTEYATVYRTTVADYVAYRIDSTYSWNGHQLTNWCITALNEGKACHFMILCDTSMMAAYAPIFEYVLSSLKFI